MKKPLKLTIGITVTLSIILTIFSYWQGQKKYEEYANEKLNTNFYKVCDHMIDANAIIENIIDKGYILGTDLEHLENQHIVYLRSLSELNYISNKFYKFNFFSAEVSHNFNREYSNFYYRIDNLLNDRGYDFYSANKYQLSNEDLEVFKESYEYTLKAVEIIKNHIEYYNTFDMVITEDLKTGESQLKKEYKKEYLIPWPDNKRGISSMSSIDEEGTLTEIPIEIPRYDYPEKPFLKISDKNWINIHKGIYLINIE